jgi:tetratricopeptide (TPR) repeat protein
MKRKGLKMVFLVAVFFAAGAVHAHDAYYRIEVEPRETADEQIKLKDHELKTREYLDEKEKAERIEQSEEFCRIGDMYYEKGDVEKAVAYYERAIMFDENNIYAHERLTVAAEARDAMEKAVSERYHRAMEYFRKGMIDQAIDELVTEIKENPENEAVRIRLKEIETRYR